jgi:hypothetical protein
VGKVQEKGAESDGHIEFKNVFTYCISQKTLDTLLENDFFSSFY